jgi:ribonuclease HII
MASDILNESENKAGKKARRVSSSKNRTKKKTESLRPSNDGALFELGDTDSPYVMGLDEVGVACLAGPVVAACFAYPLNDQWRALKPEHRVCDSKLLQAPDRERSENFLRELPGAVFATGEASVDEIDEINIFWARMLAMSRAFERVRELLELREPVGSQGALVLVDGNFVPKQLRSLDPALFQVRSLVKGDARCFACAAASIFAKNYRDKLMQNLAKEWPQYGWEENVGYPTPFHREALKAHGPSRLHRKSFRLDY